MTQIKQVLTIAGSDSGGGAGIQADIKAMSANGVFAMSVITAVTAQNTEEVTDVFELPASIIAAQIDAVFDDFDVAAVKTGMLSSAEIVRIVAKMLAQQKISHLIVDPVMLSEVTERGFIPGIIVFGVPGGHKIKNLSFRYKFYTVSFVKNNTLPSIPPCSHSAFRRIRSSAPRK